MRDLTCCLDGVGVAKFGNGSFAERCVVAACTAPYVYINFFIFCCFNIFSPCLVLTRTRTLILTVISSTSSFSFLLIVLFILHMPTACSNSALSLLITTILALAFSFSPFPTIVTFHPLLYMGSSNDKSFRLGHTRQREGAFAFEKH